MEDDEVMTFVWEKPEPPRYYIPLTLNQLVERIKGIIKNSDGELTGEEYVVGSLFLPTGDMEFPPNTLIFSVRKDGLTKNETEYGNIYIMPGKTRTLM